MPTYSYACTDCGDRFDAVQAFSDDALTTCTKCSGRLRKLFGSVGVVFKGSGFYRNDSRSSSTNTGSNSTKSEKSADSGSSGSADSSSSSTANSTANSSSSSSSSTPAPAAASS